MKVGERKTAAPAQNSGDMAITPKGLRMLLAGVLVLVAGYVLLAGGGTKDPQVFSEAMFDFRRLVAAPVVMIAGLVVEVVAIMGLFKPREDVK